MNLRLQPHPDSLPTPVREFVVDVRRTPGGRLRLAYSLCTDSGRPLVPAPASSDRREQLWRHTCFEAFIALGTAPRYAELNFSPSTEWAMYGFEQYRAPLQTLTDLQMPLVTVSSADQQGPGAVAESSLQLVAELDLAGIARWLGAQPAPATASSLCLALCAVVEDRAGRLSYWSLRHGGAKPDFHAREGFVCKLDIDAVNGND